jgi:hypothetical protein
MGQRDEVSGRCYSSDFIQVHHSLNYQSLVIETFIWGEGLGAGRPPLPQKKTD